MRLDPAQALAEERGLVGALILEPAMIRVMAPLRPPAWFTHDRCLAVMRALFCIQSPDLDIEEVVAALELHGDLELAGGRAGVEALVLPGPELDAAREDLRIAREELQPLESEAIVIFARRLLDAAPKPET